MASRNFPFKVIESSTSYAVVEFVDDIELLHGYGVGIPSVGLKIALSSGKYRIASVFNDNGHRRVVVVEPV